MTTWLCARIGRRRLPGPEATDARSDETRPSYYAVDAVIVLDADDAYVYDQSNRLAATRNDDDAVRVGITTRMRPPPMKGER